MKKFIFLTLLIGVLVLAGCGASDDTPVDNGDDAPVVTDGDGEPVDDGEEGDETPDPSDDEAGLQTYTNEEYGFEISYPERYEITTDTSGWPNAVALFREPEGQAYDVQIEVWDTGTAFNEKYAKDPLGGQWQDVDSGKFVSVNYYEKLDDAEYMQEWGEAVETFKFTE